MNTVIFSVGAFFLIVGLLAEPRGTKAALLGTYVVISPIVWGFWRTLESTNSGGSNRALGVIFPEDHTLNWLFFGHFHLVILLGGVIAISPIVIRLIGRLSGRRRGPTPL